MKKGKVFDVQEFLSKQAVTIRVSGKDYTVTDIPVEVTEMLNENPVPYQKAVAKLLGCEESELDGLGVVAFNKIIAVVNENLFQGVISPGNQ